MTNSIIKAFYICNLCMAVVYRVPLDNVLFEREYWNEVP